MQDLPISVLLLTIWHAVSAVHGQQVAAPLIFPSAEDVWLGNDGPWSVFNLLVGEPAQQIRVLPATSATSVFSVIQAGCDIPLANCSNLRGGIYAGNQSVTFVQADVGSDRASPDANLDVGLAATVGFDSVSLGDSLPAIDHTVVVQIANTSLWLGLFGLSPQANSFTTFGDPIPTFFTQLRGGDWIASRTWSYTAGSYNRKVAGSVIFGGYDVAAIDPATTISTTLDANSSAPLLVKLNSIVSRDSLGPAQTLLDSPIEVNIDSATPYLWLPFEACHAFEQAFGLVTDTTTGLYLVNSTLHDALNAQDFTVSFTIEGSNSTTSALTMSWSAFNLSVSYPIVNTTQSYFPLQCTANSSQYTLGRAFLQEVYITADYDRATVNISQATLDAAVPRVFAITPPDNTTTGTASNATAGNSTATPASVSPPPADASLSGGAIAGIVVGVVAGVLLLYLAFAFFTRRRPFRRAPGASPPIEEDTGKAELHGEGIAFAEAPGSSEKHEVSGEGRPFEADPQGARYEMPAEVPPQELPAQEEATRTKSPAAR